MDVKSQLAKKNKVRYQNDLFPNHLTGEPPPLSLHSLIRKTFEFIQKKHRIRNKEKFKKQIVLEIVRFIEKQLVINNTSYFYIYKGAKTPESGFSNSLHLEDFFGIWNPNKKNKKCCLFSHLFMKEQKEKEILLTYFFNELGKYYSKLDDIQTKKGTRTTGIREVHWLEICIISNEEDS
ncbi:hypothetical protein [Bacillus sp. Brlt_9]|uniref:hypothetical protein n=1 Tax=Bacillus sp. Brlt_9 TaxID=3110916 RepID=UPI003F7C4D19